MNESFGTLFEIWLFIKTLIIKHFDEDDLNFSLKINTGTVKENKKNI